MHEQKKKTPSSWGVFFCSVKVMWSRRFQEIDDVIHKVLKVSRKPIMAMRTTIVLHVFSITVKQTVPHEVGLLGINIHNSASAEIAEKPRAPYS